MMNEDRLSYNDLIESFTEEVLEDRIAFLQQFAKDYLEIRKLTDYSTVSLYILEQVVTDYFSDIKRQKDFHLIEKTNTAKVAAYSAYWILKRKPLQINQDVSYQEMIDNPYLRNLNEGYAFAVMKGMFFNRYQPIPSAIAEKQKTINLFESNLFYSFKYRNYTAQVLETILLGLKIDPYLPLLESIKD